jgi:hypothetical protein
MQQQHHKRNSEGAMLWTIFVTLLVLWLLGVVSANTFGGFIHVLLALAVAVALLRALRGRSSVN